MNIWTNAIGFLIILIVIIEIFSGVAMEKTGFIRRNEKPVYFWFSVICKLIVALMILNIEYLQSIYGR